MQLTQYTDYALRTLLFLGTVNRMSTITEIAEVYGISRNHLVKVVHHLGKLGYLNTVKGKSGGIKLGKDPAEINLGRFVREVEPNFHLVECFNPVSNGCPITAACLLSGVLVEAERSFFAVLSKYTLKDLLANRAELDSCYKMRIS
jgi:Rrf2 family nitric oxide-sensitive transcriptional repressor